MSSGGARGAPEEAGSVRGGAPGVPEARNMSGMLSAMSILLFMAFGELKTEIFEKSLKTVHLKKKRPYVHIGSGFLLETENLDILCHPCKICQDLPRFAKICHTHSGGRVVALSINKTCLFMVQDDWGRFFPFQNVRIF